MKTKIVDAASFAVLMCALTFMLCAL